LTVYLLSDMVNIPKMNTYGILSREVEGLAR